MNSVQSVNEKKKEREDKGTETALYAPQRRNGREKGNRQRLKCWLPLPLGVKRCPSWRKKNEREIKAVVDVIRRGKLSVNGFSVCGRARGYLAVR